jgi:hypothetical protein
VHVPTLLATSHAAHSSVQAVLQHTPSTQKPEPHWALAVQAPPSGLLHVPAPFALHTWPLGHEEVVQHAPSTHVRPETHSSVFAQLPPAGLVGRQVGALQ